MKRIFTLICFVMVSLQTYANSSQIEIDTTTINSQFFVAIIAGVLLALIFQVLLTALSVALGISMIGNVKQNYVDSKVKPSEKNTKDKYLDENYDYDTSSGVKISSAFGVWSLLTTAIALFAASALALNLSFFGSVASNITVALVIWALFFLILFYLETRIVNTVVGGLVTTATSGLKSSANTIKSFFSTSDDKKVQQTIDHTVDKIRKEFDFNVDTDQLSNVLDNFLNKVDNKVPDYDTLKSDLESIAQQSKSKNNTGKYMAIQQVVNKAIEKGSDNESIKNKDKNEKLKTILAELKDAYTSDKPTKEGVKEVVAEYTSLEKSEIDDKLKQIEDYIASATPDQLSDSSLDTKFKSIISDPKAASAILSTQFQDLNKDKIIESLSKNTQLDKSQLNTYADKLESILSQARKTVEENDINTLKANVEQTIAGFFDSSDQDNLNYTDLKTDINKIYNNPKDSLSIIKSRLDSLDADTVKALVTNNKYIKSSDIDSVSSQINETINGIKSQVSSIESKAHEQLEMTKRKAVIQAEHARKTAASAAWWLVITVVVSGGAAMLGAWLELS